MQPEHLHYAERQAPRYTSYPTAPHFNTGVDADTVARWLAELPATSRLSLYLHVPYCQSLCWYCGCNTYAARRDEPVLDYVDTVLKEIELAASKLTARQVVEIHWGGGTPNILSEQQFETITQRLARRFDIAANAQHAIELDPRFITRDKADAYVRAGVNRASLGVQDLNARVQQAIGRVQPLEIVEAAVATLRAAGLNQISMDLMYGLPHQTTDDLSNTIRLAAAMAPNRIALFGYAHVPWFKKRQRLIPEAALPGASERFDQAEAARIELQRLGYVAIGLDHFALPEDEFALARDQGRLRRSFQGYVVQDADALVGFGPSAISTLPQGYAQNAPEPGAWGQMIAQGQLAIVRGHKLDDADRIRRRLIEQIMCDFSADLAPLGGAEACASELETLAPMFADGMVQLEGDRILLSEKARPFCRLTAMAFDAYAASGAARHSRAV
ncbi:MAG: oxygen-independent coproporphyrinogen III oxidase [Hyphomonadaceae bacterium]|nr:oxygen-independent coproporphyrinogen III oxidase [Hyphomonadaceae bacterium]